MTEQKVLAALSALSNQTRLRIFKALVVAGPHGMAAGDIAEHVGATPSRASFHLAALSDTGLLSSERAARSVTYRVDFQVMGGLVGYLLHECCGNHPSVRACC